MTYFPLRSSLLLIFSLWWVFGFVLCGDAVAQTEETVVINRSINYTGLVVTNDPGQYAMGGGTVALRGRPGAIDVNPAAIGQDGRLQAGVDVGLDPFLQSDFILGQTLTSPFAAVKSGRWAAGFQFVQFSYGTFERRSPEGQVLSEIEKYHRTLKAVGAYDLSPTWTAGAALGYSAEGFAADQEPSDARGLTLDLGMYGEWERTFEDGGRIRPSLGISLTDFGTNSQVTDQTEIATPTRLRAGGALAYETGSTWEGRPIVRLTGHLALSKQMVSIEETAGVREAVIDAASPFAALIQNWRPTDTERTFDQNGVSQRSVGVWGQVQKHVGAEITALDIVSFRIGRNFVDDTFAVSETAVGVGVDLEYIQVDYASTLESSSMFRGDLSYVRVTSSLPLDGTFDRLPW